MTTNKQGYSMNNERMVELMELPTLTLVELSRYYHDLELNESLEAIIINGEIYNRVMKGRDSRSIINNY